MKPLKDRGLVYLFVLGIGMLAIFIGYAESRFVPRAAAAPTTFIVFNTNDGGAGSLRQAILNANANLGLDTIKFNLPPGGNQTISPGSALPTITDPVIIDGYSQIATSPNNQTAGDNAVLSVEIDGTNLKLVGVDPCLTITAGGSTVQGLVINRCRFGIRLDTGGGNTIQGNFIGTDPTGTISRANTAGVDIVNSPSNTIGGTTPAARNLISGNSTGIQIQSSPSTGNVVAGNFIGTTAAGTAGLGNSTGVRISDAPGNTIGGTTAGARNLISGNSTGISLINAGATGNVVAGNFIGTTPDGTAAVGQSTGLNIAAPGNTIGGTTVAARNIISGNSTGISFTTGAATNLVQGNYIGLNSAGAAGVTNNRGVNIQNGATNNLIGGTAAGARNIISGNSLGVSISTTSPGANNRVEGNFFGTDPAGTTGIAGGNAVIISGPGGNVIGGTAAGAGNLIANSGGIFVDATSSGTSILGNSMAARQEIDLNGDGVTANDLGDTDTGGNNLQNYPVVTSATSSGSNTTIGATLNSIPNSAFRIEFFSNTALDNVGFGPGQTFIGSTTVNTDGSGNATFTVNTGSATPSGQFITTTATNNATGDTSEFSAGVQVNGPETFQFLATDYRVSENAGTATITVTRANGGGSGSTVNYRVGSAIALEGLDFGATSGTLTFGVGETSKSFTVPIIDDVLLENEEFAIAFLTNPSMGAVVGINNSVRLNIDDREQTMWGVTRFNTLISFERAQPSLLYSRVPITGAQILGIDFRPSNGLLYGLGSTSRLYTINTSTGLATEVGVGPFSPALSGSDFGFDFNPAADLIRVVSNASQNLRLDPDTGAVANTDTTLAYAGSDPNAAAIPNIVALGYTNNVAGATSTTLYGIDSAKDTLVRIGSPGGTPTSPNSGQLTTIGPLGFDTGSFTSLDILAGDKALAAVTQQGLPISFLHRINLLTGSSTEISSGFSIPYIGGDKLVEPVRAMSAATNGSIGFSSATAGVSEGAGKVQLTLNRTGDISGAAAVELTTSDGTAVQFSDYNISFATVFFAPGEASKTVDIFITDDGYSEASETFTVGLTNPQGGFQVGGITSNTVTIADNDIAPAVVNPIEGASFFVRQHYIDFLNRAPDTPGLNFWTNEITSCGANAQCIDLKRVNVSAAFFLSIEFQKTGALVYLTHKAAVGSNFPGPAPVPVLYSQFEHDAQTLQQGLIFGQPNFDLTLEGNKQAFFADFVARPQFEVPLPVTLTPTQFVDALIANTGAAVPAATRTTAINGFFGAASSNLAGRASALRLIVESPAFAAAEFNRTFVTMEYFGYLRRDPDAGGFNFWLNKLNNFNGNFVNADMVKSFITSGEYRSRIGAN